MRLKWVFLLFLGVLLSIAAFFMLRPQSTEPATDTIARQEQAQPGTASSAETKESASTFVSPAPAVGPDASPRQEKERAVRSAITIHEGRLSLSVENRRLNRVLEEIQNKTSVMIVNENLEDRSISLQFQDIPLDEGLRLLLRDFDTFFFYNGNDGFAGPPNLKAVWVYPKGLGQTIMPVPAEKWASTAELQADLASADVEARVRAIDGLIVRGGSESVGVVLNALADKDDTVRNRALYKALDTGMQLPPDTLAHLALADQDPAIRLMALQALAEREADRRAQGQNREPDAGADDAKAVVQRVMVSDPNPELREEAKTMLMRLNNKPSPGD